MHLRLSKCKRLKPAFNMGFWPYKRCFPYKKTSFSRLEKALLLIRQNRTSLYKCRRYYSFCKFLFISQRFFVGFVYIVACTSRDISQQILMRRFRSLDKIMRYNASSNQIASYKSVVAIETSRHRKQKLTSKSKS